MSDSHDTAFTTSRGVGILGAYSKHCQHCNSAIELLGDGIYVGFLFLHLISAVKEKESS